ncbi:MAG TPA: MFS transporter [Ramlibacter sp.]|uniref:MFS transporter n=1 Tax=Ramlibacter sp. TaxID=1917967 RepID=UPI002D7F57CC|nr:MFS transporter [Ramlibacter sp.]HET8745769.1 MFS transporter [Ramlibacter sp.]
MQITGREWIESPYAWGRLAMSLLLMTIGGSGMYSITVVLPRMQQDFGIARGDASLPYTLTMVGFGIGGILMGRLADRFGVMRVVMLGGVGLGLGYIAAGLAPSAWLFGAAQGLLVGLLGTSASFAPLVADTTRWFDRRRGIALAICMSGNYTAGTVWPPVMQHFIDTVGWRQTYVGMGLFCLASMLPLAIALRRPPPQVVLTPPASAAPVAVAAGPAASPRPLGMAPGLLLALLSAAGVACCVAMSMPQVHIVAYCGDLGFGAARGAEMLSLMLAMGVVSRLVSGWIADRIGGLRTLLLGSLLQGVALLLFLPSDALVSLYIVSALFGLFQGGIVPCYPMIVREYFPPDQVGAKVGTVLMATLMGMALGGWMSGAVFDLTGSYHAAFLNGIAWNLLNLSIVGFLLWRATSLGLIRGWPAAASRAAA